MIIKYVTGRLGVLRPKISSIFKPIVIISHDPYEFHIMKNSQHRHIAQGDISVLMNLKEKPTEI